ncbi:MAG TPA: helix-turn-helix transcriptional regulator [Thermomicrobiales bacterium]
MTSLGDYQLSEFPLGIPPLALPDERRASGMESAARQELRRSDELLCRAIMAVAAGQSEAALADATRSLMVFGHVADMTATAARATSGDGDSRHREALAAQTLALLELLPGRLRIGATIVRSVAGGRERLLAAVTGMVRQSSAIRELLGEIGLCRLLADLQTAIEPERSVQSTSGSTSAARAGGISPTVLSPRERQVLGLMAEGLTNQQIGARLGIKGITVNTFASRIFNKLGVDNRAAAAAYAVRHGLVSL